MDGSLSAPMTLTPSCPRACMRPMEVTVLPSPALVAVIAVTRISLPLGRSSKRRSTSRGTLAMYRPCSSSSSRDRPTVAATVSIGSILASWAMSMSAFIASNRKRRIR